MKWLHTTEVKRELRTFEDLTRFPLLFYRTIGEDLHSERDGNLVRRFLLRLLLILGFMMFNTFVLGEIMYFFKHITSTSTLLEATAVAPCIGFSLMANCKQASLMINRRTLVQLLDELSDIFPKSSGQQLAYRVAHYERNMNRVMTIFTILCLTYTSSFSFYPAFRAAINYYLLGSERFDRNFGFLIWFPYDAQSNLIVYWATYCCMAYSAYLAGVAFICSDLLLIMTITQLCMHFSYIAEQLEHYRASEYSDPENLSFLRTLAEHHSRVLDLSDRINDIFKFSILFNFMAASLIICFAGFQITAANVEDIILYLIFFTASLVQVFIVCFYGDELITSSSRIGHSAFNHDWYICSQEYKCILRIMLVRSQKPASIRPPTFPPISFVTFMNVISMSYQFFALLRTTYYE